MALPLVYDPKYHTFESWSALMIEGYAAQQLQMNVSEENWYEFAAGMMAIDIFQNESLPSPYLFENWQDWAQALVGAVNSRETAT